MPTVIAALVAVIGALVQGRRHRDRNAADVHLVWWMVAVVGVASLVGAAYHVFDGPQTAELIGYTRGNGGFQWENAMGDTSIGVIGILAYWFRGHFWLCTIIVLSIQYIGDGAGHVYYWVVEHDTKPYNIGFPLWTDFLLPVVMWALYLWSRRTGGDAIPKASEVLHP